MPIVIETLLIYHSNCRTIIWPLFSFRHLWACLLSFHFKERCQSESRATLLSMEGYRGSPSLGSSSFGGILQRLKFISAGLVVQSSSIQHSKSSSHVMPHLDLFREASGVSDKWHLKVAIHGYHIPAMTCMVGWQLSAGQWQAPPSPNEYRDLYSDVGIDHVHCAWRHGPRRPITLNTVTMLHIPCSPGWLVKNKSGLERGSSK
jgi:hypothetical protein